MLANIKQIFQLDRYLILKSLCLFELIFIIKDLIEIKFN